MNTHKIGNFSEQNIICRLLSLDRVVLKPVGEGHRYDLLMDNQNGTFTRIQCKTARVTKNGCLSFATGSRGGYKKQKNRGYKGEADVFLVYSPMTQQVYYIPVDMAPEGSMLLRLQSPERTVNRNIHWASDFEI